MPTTLRIELDKLGFDWHSGQLALQDGRGWESPGKVREVKRDDAVLEQRFQNGPTLDLPRFFATDKHAQYIVYRSEHGSGLKRVLKGAKDYLGTCQALPYPD